MSEQHVYIVSEEHGWGESFQLGIYSSMSKAEDRVLKFMAGNPKLDLKPQDRYKSNPDLVLVMANDDPDVAPELIVTKYPLDPEG